MRIKFVKDIAKSYQTAPSLSQLKAFWLRDENHRMSQ